MKKSDVRFAHLKAFFDAIGFTAVRDKRGWCFEHKPTGAAFHFRPYRLTEYAYAHELSRVRWHLEARGLMTGAVFDESLAMQIACKQHPPRR